MYYFPRVRTWYILVCTVFITILQWMLFYVMCLWETILCVHNMYAVVLHCSSNTKSVPLLLSNIHDIISVHTQYILVCTCLYYSTFPVPVCTRYALVRTASEPVHTKYPVPVMRLTIPDGVTVTLNSVFKSRFGSNFG